MSSSSKLQQIIVFFLGFVFTGSLFYGIDSYLGQLADKGEYFWRSANRKRHLFKESLDKKRIFVSDVLNPKNRHLNTKIYEPHVLPLNSRKVYGKKFIPAERISIEPNEKVGIADSFLRVPSKPYRVTFSARLDGKTLEPYLDSYYTIDSFYRRVTPGDNKKKNAKSFVMLIGDSNVYGSGVRDEQTLSARMASRLPYQKVYNYGLAGASPGELLERTKYIIKDKELPEQNGIALYFFSDDHIDMNMGSLSQISSLKSWGANRNYYYQNTKGEIVTDGKKFREARPVWTNLAVFLRKLGIVRYFELDIQPREKDWHFQIEIYKQMQANLKKHGVHDFYVVITPKTTRAAEMISYLEKENMKYINMGYWEMQKYTRELYHQKNTLLFSAESNDIIATALVDSLNENL